MDLLDPKGYIQRLLLNNGHPFLAELQLINSRSYCAALHHRDVIWYLWKTIVEEFTSRELTFPKDRPLALAGVVKIFFMCCSPNTSYLAGLWRRDHSDFLITQLLWNVRSKKLPRPKKYRGPSWSLVSIDGAIEFFNGEHIEDLGRLAWVVDADVKTANGYLNGEVKSASITLRASLVPFDDQDGIIFDQDTSDPVSSQDQLYLLGLLESYLESSVLGLVIQESTVGYQRLGIFKSHHDTDKFWSVFKYRLKSEVVLV
jgi:hypothetical protein